MSNTVCQMLEQTKCKGKEELETLMEKVVSGRGEGIMLKDPKSKYEGRRSEKLLKVKRFEDAEAVVIGHLKGTGRCETMCGAI